jgi:cytosine/adenosine deaminase-related metal-dependent hydrolase
MTTVDAFLTNCRLADSRLVDIGIADGKIAIVGEGAASALSNSAPALDIGGDLVLPGLVDGHMHLDKTLTGLPWMGHAAGPTRMSRIETDKTILPHLPLSTEERAGNLTRECVARGTSHMRTHVDIDLESGLAKLEGLLAARERYRDRATVQIVAFPQSGAMRSIRWTKQTVNIPLRQLAHSMMDLSLSLETQSNLTKDHQEAVWAFAQTGRASPAAEYPSKQKGGQ